MAPARDLRDTETQPVSPDQVPLSEDLSLQRTAVELVMADFESARTARVQRKYGTTAKGETLDFDKWLKELTDLYFSRRIPKTIPWKYSSNRSLAIAMAILETLHARIFPAVYNEELTRWRPTEFTDVEKAERVEKFMFWWVRVHAKLREFFDRWTRQVIGFDADARGRASAPERVAKGLEWVARKRHAAEPGFLEAARRRFEVVDGEAAFVSAAHSEEDIERTIAAARAALVHAV
jgi:hypothetical protein